MTQQVRTFSCSVKAIMRHRHFAIGFDDIRSGRPFNCDLDDGYWAYERGRLLGAIMPLSMSLYAAAGKLNPKAVALFQAACERRLIREEEATHDRADHRRSQAGAQARDG